MPQPFSGIHVVEFGQFIAVPYAAQLLADGGAEVIKVEPLDGEGSRSLTHVAPGETRHFIIRNRGKRSLPLDLRNPAAQPILTALLARADVVLTNLRPGLAHELGLDYQTLAAKHPRIIVGNVTAFGEKGPDAGLAGMDLVVQARSGLMATMGRMKDGLPAAGESPIADYMCAVLLAYGIASALYQREHTGHGAPVDTSLLAAALLLQNNMIVRVESADAERLDTFAQWLAEARAAGTPYAEQAATMPGSRPTAMTSVYYRTYATKDSAMGIACVSPALRRRFMRALELEDPALDRVTNPDASLREHYIQLQQTVEALMATRTAAEWQATFNAHGVPAAEVRFPLEMLTDPQAIANNLLHDLEHPLAGPTRVLSTPGTLGEDGFQPAPPTQPFASQTRQILEDLALDAPTIESALASNAAREDSPFQ